MDLLINSLLTIIGFFFLVWGAALLVDGAVSIARKVGISNLVIGMTLVAFGTSAPELAASLNASIKGFGDIACGNIIGSNIANLGLVMGFSALIVPISVKRTTIFWEIPFVITVSVIFWFMERNLMFSRWDGIILVILFLVFTVYCFVTARSDLGLDVLELDEIEKHSLKTTKALLYSGAGVIFLAGGSDFLVQGATGLAHAMGVSDAVVAVSIVALGTSLPELFTSVVAVYKGEGDISIGNILGSNIFNFLIVGGLTALIHPFSISERILTFDTPVMLFVTLLLFVIVATGRRVSRAEGALYLAFYITYITLVYKFPDGISFF
jgi:cation:H+ antiporter